MASASLITIVVLNLTKKSIRRTTPMMNNRNCHPANELHLAGKEV